MRRGVELLLPGLLEKLGRVARGGMKARKREGYGG